MDTQRMVVDTSCLIEFIRTKNKANTALVKLPRKSELYLPSITEFEFLAGADTPEKKQQAHSIMKDFIRLPFDKLAAERAADIFIYLKKSGQIIGRMDILIAATALIHDLPILTLNRKDFARIPKLKLVKMQ